MSNYYQPLRNTEPDYPQFAASVSTSLDPSAWGISVSTDPPLYVPILGPKPYNTLVVVRAVSGFILGGTGAGNVTARFSFTFPTNFQAAAYAVGAEAKSSYEHSTIASLYGIHADQDIQFTAAIDQIDDAFFDTNGVWTIKTNIACFNGGAPWFVFVYRVSSWVLCDLPQIPVSRVESDRSLALPVVSGGKIGTLVRLRPLQK